MVGRTAPKAPDGLHVPVVLVPGDELLGKGQDAVPERIQGALKPVHMPHPSPDAPGDGCQKKHNQPGNQGDKNC